MKGLTNGVRLLTAAALLVAMPTVTAFAATPQAMPKTTPATNANTNVPAVPRAIPDLIKYGKFDPPIAKLFDLKKLTISGDIRVRPEFRESGCFGGGGSSTNGLTSGIGSAGCTNSNGSLAIGTAKKDRKADQLFTQQLVRLGFNYDISDDVRFFVQAQVSNNFGTAQSGVNPNTTGNTFFMRQGYMLVRNFLVPNLSIKAGRQLVVWGNHRIFGHFDWNNVGFAFDGVTLRYNHNMFPVEVGWLRVFETELAANAGGVNPATTGSGHRDGDIIFVRVPANIAGIKIEPAWIFESGGAGGSFVAGGQHMNQNRHTVGGRVSANPGIFDATVEGYYQFGDIGVSGTAGTPPMPTGSQRTLNIDAYAFHADAGVTLPVPMQPRIGAEFNYASGDKDQNTCTGTAGGGHTGCSGNAQTFSQLFPTNHIHFGYMDLMSWQNMMTWGGNLQMRPTANSHFEVAGHSMHLAKSDDNWYRANQAVYFKSPSGNNINSLGWELDAVYTLFFQGNHVGWQIGYGHFFAGNYVDQAARLSNLSASDQDWGYTQLWINF